MKQHKDQLNAKNFYLQHLQKVMQNCDNIVSQRRKLIEEETNTMRQTMGTVHKSYDNNRDTSQRSLMQSQTQSFLDFDSLAARLERKQEKYERMSQVFFSII